MQLFFVHASEAFLLKHALEYYNVSSSSSAILQIKSVDFCHLIKYSKTFSHLDSKALLSLLRSFSQE